MTLAPIWLGALADAGGCFPLVEAAELPGDGDSGRGGRGEGGRGGGRGVEGKGGRGGDGASREPAPAAVRPPSYLIWPKI
jgi:hypothetical protein